jgi:hypothetical protein
VPDEVDYRNIPWKNARFDEEAAAGARPATATAVAAEAVRSKAFSAGVEAIADERARGGPAPRPAIECPSTERSHVIARSTRGT